MKIKLVKHQI
ncbi:UNVERIFIED_CONTAM: hypothetical protein GTU68_064558 [Idotea baltica]|nr:hypothetical protein [Idotea baltica]